VAIFNPLALGALAFGLIWAARKLRGWTSYADAFFPLALLNLAQGENLIHSWMIQYVCSTVLAGTVLILMLRTEGGPSLRAVVIAGTCTFLLPLCGANGLALAPCFALWLAYLGFRGLREPTVTQRWTGALASSFALAAIVLVGAYFGGFGHEGSSRPDLRMTLKGSGQLLSLAFGQAVSPYWKWFAIGIGVLLLGSLAIALTSWLRRPAEWCRAFGLLMFLGAEFCLIVPTARGRADFAWGPVIDQGRYVLLPVLILVACYFIWELFSPSAAGLVQMCLFVCATVLFVPNCQIALGTGELIRNDRKAFERDLLAGMPPYVLAERHGVFLWTPPGSKDYTSEETQYQAEFLRKLKRAGVKIFRGMQDPIFRAVEVPIVPTLTNDMQVDSEGMFRLTGANPYVVVKLPEIGVVSAIRVKFFVEPQTLPEQCTIFFSWKHTNCTEFDLVEGGRRNSPQLLRDLSSEKERTIWVDESVDQLLIAPNAPPHAFRVAKMEVLLKSGSAVTSDTLE
jgi:hypothetical protein